MPNKLEKAYIITSGEYSDYSVHAVCLDKETAEKWVEHLNRSTKYESDNCVVEETLLIPYGSVPFTVKKVKLIAELFDDGTENIRPISIQESNPVTMWEGVPPARPKARKMRAPYLKDRGGVIEIVARTVEAAQKVLGEQLLMWRAAEPKKIYWEGK